MNLGNLPIRVVLPIPATTCGSMILGNPAVTAATMRATGSLQRLDMGVGIVELRRRCDRTPRGCGKPKW